MAPAPTGSCHLYRFWVRHPATGQKALGYIGETARHPFTRLMEHIYSQPWADTIVGWDMDEYPYPDKSAVLAAERRAILAESPLYNVEHNGANPYRIPPPVAQEQAAARRAGRPQPVPRQRAATRPAARFTGRVATRPAWLPSKRTLRRVARNRFAQATGAWLLVTAATSVLLTSLQAGAVTSSVLMGIAVAGRSKGRRRRRRR